MNARTELPALSTPALEFAAIPAGIQVPYVARGAGEPLVFIHGSLCDYRYWNGQADVLSKHFLCIAPSLSHYWPGDGVPVPTSFDWKTHVDEMAAFIAAMGVGPVHLVGHSRGGCIAFQLACAYPQLVKTLTLADPGGPLQIDGTPDASLPPATLALRADVAAMIERGEIDAGLERFVDSVSMPGIWRKSPASFRTMAVDNASTLPKQFRDLLPAYTRAAASKITCPTLLIAGEKSPRMYRNNADRLAQWIGRATTERIAGASHGMNVTHPAAFNRLLEAFVRAQAQPALPAHHACSLAPSA